MEFQMLLRPLGFDAVKSQVSSEEDPVTRTSRCKMNLAYRDSKYMVQDEDSHLHIFKPKL